MPCTEEQKEYARERYAVRCEDEEYREKVREWGRQAYYRKRERMRDAGVIIRGRGRPRKYQQLPDEMLAVLSEAGLTMDDLYQMMKRVDLGLPALPAVEEKN